MKLEGITLTLNRTDNSALQNATKAKQALNESMADAWSRILSQKNSPADLSKLQAVRAAMSAGKIGREATTKPKRFSKAEALRLYAKLSLMQREEKIEEVAANIPENYVLVTSKQQLQQIIDLSLTTETIIAVDTETTGLDVYIDVIVGVSLTLPKNDIHYYIPIRPTKDVRALAPEDAFPLLKIIMESTLEKVLHNAIYDMNMFARHEIDLKNIVWDTMTAMHLLNENEPSYQLKKLATKYLAEPSDTFEELFGKDAQFADVPLDVALAYAAKDTHLTWKLYEFQLRHLSNLPTILEYFREVEMPLIYAVYDMERTGFEIDMQYAKRYGKEMKAEIDVLERSLTEKFGGININSTQQLKPALEDKLGIDLENLDAKKTLKPLAKQFDIVAELLHYRELNKLYSTYISVLPEKVHPVTGRVHARFNPNGARTGRFSSGGNGVNLQNQPYAARKLFVAPEGYAIVGGDFSAQEIRCAAYKTGEPLLIDAFNKGRDPYATLAAEFFKKPYEEVYKNPDDSDTVERKMMKTGMLACLYGTGRNTLAPQLKCTPNEAQAFLDDFFSRYKYIKRWIDDTKRFVKENGFVWMDKQQRKRRLPVAKRKTNGYDWEVAAALRQGPNAEIQGTSAIQSKKTLVNLHKLCKERGWKLWCTVHDEILVLMPIDFTMDDIKAFEDVMLHSYTFGDIPNKTDIEISLRWGEGVSVSEWFNRKAAN